ncbi:unnamed protein product [Vitrella brassicaformis CCMP3155]|uniref:Uncharacterized protein n=2 Tax=Vitrella brassicaformis TaxID=1169539 RepID=A0A0G4ENC6_VITBC|nr:unnamed protein product [Vitrella brassicaformis CCMP3155]|eukprot:CEL99337.1 unnamed protein product [Vitrella brassicaformis CCMP3155]
MFSLHEEVILQDTPAQEIKKRDERMSHPSSPRVQTHKETADQLIEAERQIRQQQERLTHADLERRLAAVERQQAAWRDEQQTATIRQLQDSNAAMGSKIDALKAQLVEGDTALAESEKHVGTARADVEALKVVLAQLVSGMESAAVRRRTVRH